MPHYARIVTFDEFKTIKRVLDLGIIGCTSGGYDPVHPGHLSCLIESKKHCDTLVAVVNGDWFLANKKGKSFQDLKTRCQIISCVRGVDFVIPFEIENDTTVCKAIEEISPNIFFKGGSDRVDQRTIPEWVLCEKLGIKVMTNMGLDKLWSSSDFLKEWEKFVLKKLNK
jgi:cytidyltransferase-like protein